MLIIIAITVPKNKPVGNANKQKSPISIKYLTLINLGKSISKNKIDRRKIIPKQMYVKK